MRIRTIKPEFWQNPELASVTAEAHLLAAALISFADDQGYFVAIPERIKGELFAMRQLSRSIPELLDELYQIEWISLCVGIDQRPYGHIKTFVNHQRINRPSPSRIAPQWRDTEKFTEDSLRTHGGLTEDSLRTHDRNRDQGSGIRESITSTSASEVDEVLQKWNTVAKEHGYQKSRGTEPMRSHIRKRLREATFNAHWREALDCLMAGGPHSHLRGANGWRANLTWFLRPSALPGILEGNWEGPQQQTAPDQPPPPVCPVCNWDLTHCQCEKEANADKPST